MCLIIAKVNEDSKLPHFSIIEEATISGNDDGIGVMYVEDGRVRMKKKLFPKTSLYYGTSYGGDEDVAIAQGKFFDEYKDKDNVAFHLRFATHGKTTVDMCHPFRILTKGERLNNGERSPIDLCMMHNGMISTVDCDVVPANSDTWHLAKQFIRPLLLDNPELIYAPQFQLILSEFVMGSKLLFLDSDGNNIIINEEDGLYHNKAWYSNNNYTPSLFPRKPWSSKTSTDEPEVDEWGFTAEDYMEWSDDYANASDYEAARQRRIEQAEDAYCDDNQDWNGRTHSKTMVG